MVKLSVKNTLATFGVIFLFSLLLLLAIPYLSRGSIEKNSMLAFIGFFFLTIALIKSLSSKMSGGLVSALLVISLIIINSYGIFLYFTESPAFLPLLFFYFSAILSAYFYCKFKRKSRFVPVSISLIFVLMMFFQGWNDWNHFANYGTFSGRVHYRLPAKLEARDENQNLISSDNFTGKVVLLDFWHTRCGICFTKFPQLESVYDKYRGNQSVLIYAVDRPIEEDEREYPFEVVKNKGYSFPVAIVNDVDVLDNLGVSVYPTTMVIDRVGNIVFFGDIENAIPVLDAISK